jgi:Baseplate J-like protein
MAYLPPKIDQRTYEEIVQQIEALAQQFSDWKPAPEGKIDAGRALIRIFGRMLKLISDRLNQVPEKNFLAFLDLIGGELEPPQPAKVPLTFYLAEGSPVDGLVPAYTQVSAPPAEGSDEEIVFETDGELVVTTTQLQAVFVREPNQDRYSDCTLAATGQEDAAFLAFAGDRPIPHSLYVTCAEIFTLPELKEFKLIIITDNTSTTDNTSSFPNLPLTWSYWDGSQWKVLTTSPEAQNPKYENNQFTFTNLPIPTDVEINGKTARWLQAKLSNPSLDLPKINNIQGRVDITQSNLIPDLCLFNATPLDLSKDFYPFGEQPELNDTFYIALNDTFIKPNTIITININLSHKPVNIKDLKITWEIGNGQVWQEIGDANNQLRWIANSSAIRFIEKDTIQAKLQFPNQENLPSPSTVNGETRYWIRARITQGYYGQTSKIRKYTIYNPVATVESSSDDNPNDIKILGNASDFFDNDDVIRLVWIENNLEKQEEYEIKNVNGSTITLNPQNPQNPQVSVNAKAKAKAKGTKIFRRDTISETIPAIYDPPLIKSLKLTYDFTITESAIYFADNDFTYSEIFTTQLKQSATSGDKIITRNFQPFTPTIDQEPTLYLGFDKSFGNKTVTLYAQVETPLPDELSTDITEKTALTEAANTGQPQPTVKLADITGWQNGDRLQIQNPLNTKQYDNYRISSISKNQVTLNQLLQQNYPQGIPVIRPQQPELVWEYSSPIGWQPLGVKDETQAFSQSGLIKFIAPADFNIGETFGKQLYWLRIRWQGGNFRVKPRLRRLLTNTIWAVQATTLREEILGSSNKEPNQTFVANNIPILMGQHLQVEEGQIPPQLKSDRIKVIRDDLGEIEAVWVQWLEVADFYGSGASDRHYILDRQTGEIRFGDGQAGMIPPRGRNNIRLFFYRTGGGKEGNVNSQTISQLKTTIPYIDRVINLEPAAGGAQQESLERLKERVPKQLRHRDRAVTFEDIVDLAYAASTDVARVKVVSPDLMTANFSPFNEKFWLDTSLSKLDTSLSKADVSFEDVIKEKSNTINNESDRNNFQTMMREINRRAGQIKVIILPHSRVSQPVPSLVLLEQVETYIRSRCEATVDLIVTAPIWQEVTVNATITPVSIEDADLVRNSVKQRLEVFLHPLTGGKGEGWQFGRYPQKSDFYAIIQSIPGVDYVNSLEVLSKEINSADYLIYSGNHTINVSSLLNR